MTKQQHKIPIIKVVEDIEARAVEVLKFESQSNLTVAKQKRKAFEQYLVKTFALNQDELTLVDKVLNKGLGNVTTKDLISIILFKNADKTNIFGEYQKEFDKYVRNLQQQNQNLDSNNILTAFIYAALCGTYATTTLTKKFEYWRDKYKDFISNQFNLNESEATALGIRVLDEFQKLYDKHYYNRNLAIFVQYLEYQVERQA